MIIDIHAACARAALVLLASAGCSTPSTMDVGTLGGAGDSSGSEQYDDDGASEAGTGGGFDPSGADPGTTGDAYDDTGSEHGDSDGGNAPPGEHAPCPDALPDTWLFCEDFEGMADPAGSFFEYQDADGAFVLDEGNAASGVHAMKASYAEGVESAGWLSVAFGENPIIYGNTPQAAAGEDFPSIYWRVRVKMEAGWPDVGPGELTSATAFASAQWQQALVARLRSDGDDTVLLAEPSSCIVGDTLACQGFDDAEREQKLGGLLGETPLFSGAAAGEWHCVEAHVALNTPGLADGAFEFWVDDELQNASYTLDWRGTWTEYGINMVTVQNLWPGGAPAELSRWIDDLVISTEPIGCD